MLLRASPRLRRIWSMERSEKDTKKPTGSSKPTRSDEEAREIVQMHIDDQRAIIEKLSRKLN
jgi:hypothetical protein